MSNRDLINTMRASSTLNRHGIGKECLDALAQYYEGTNVAAAITSWRGAMQGPYTLTPAPNEGEDRYHSHIDGRTWMRFASVVGRPMSQTGPDNAPKNAHALSMDAQATFMGDSWTIVQHLLMEIVGLNVELTNLREARDTSEAAQTNEIRRLRMRQIHNTLQYTTLRNAAYTLDRIARAINEYCPEEAEELGVLSSLIDCVLSVDPQHSE